MPLFWNRIFTNYSTKLLVFSGKRKYPYQYRHHYHPIDKHANYEIVSEFVVNVGFSIDIVIRLFQILALFTPFVPIGISFTVLYLFLPSRVMKPVLNSFVWGVIKSISLLGPAWIKLGQWASTRPDLIPFEMLSALKVFHHHSPTHSATDSMNIIQNAFSKGLDEIFSYFELVPCGSGSIAQVHKASLRHSNQPVAVKIIHPNVHLLLDVDIAILKIIGTVLDCIVPPLRWIGIKQEIDQLSRSFKSQADLRIEANNLERFLVHFHGCEDRISFPRPIYPFVSRDVLVESLEVGLPVDVLFQANEHILKNIDPLSKINHGRDAPLNPVSSLIIKDINEQVVSTIFAAFLKMLLLDNFSHADLHPGNLLIQFRRHQNVIVEPSSDVWFKSISKRNIFNTLEKCFLQARAYLWPISSFRNSVLSDLSSIEKRNIGDRMQLLLPNAKVFSPFESSPWLSESSPLNNVPSHSLSLTEQENIIKILTQEKCVNEFCGSVSIRVILLDAGLVTTLDSVRFTNFLDLFKTLVLWRDGFNVGRLLIDRNPLNRQEFVIQRDEFCRKMQFIVQNFFSSHPLPIRERGNVTSSLPLLYPLPLGSYHIGPVLINLLKLVRDHHVRLDDQYANLIMSVVFVEGLGRRLCPNLDLLPFFKQAALHYFLRS